jgi:hypothetical protein
VDTLGSGQNLLSAHEHVIRVGQARVCRGRHGIERANSKGELVEDIEVGAVLFEDELTEVFFLWGSRFDDQYSIQKVRTLGEKGCSWRIVRGMTYVRSS